MKATEQCFPVVLFIMLYTVVLTFETVDERVDKILRCYHLTSLQLFFFSKFDLGNVLQRKT